MSEESTQHVWRVTDKDGVPVPARPGRTRMQRTYDRESTAKGVATQFNNVKVFKHGETLQLEGAPFKVQHGVITWDS